MRLLLSSLTVFIALLSCSARLLPLSSSLYDALNNTRRVCVGSRYLKPGTSLRDLERFVPEWSILNSYNSNSGVTYGRTLNITRMAEALARFRASNNASGLRVNSPICPHYSVPNNVFSVFNTSSSRYTCPASFVTPLVKETFKPLEFGTFKDPEALRGFWKINRGGRRSLSFNGFENVNLDLDAGFLSDARSRQWLNMRKLRTSRLDLNLRSRLEELHKLNMSEVRRSLLNFDTRRRQGCVNVEYVLNDQCFFGNFSQFLNKSMVSMERCDAVSCQDLTMARDLVPLPPSSNATCNIPLDLSLVSSKVLVPAKRCKRYRQRLSKLKPALWSLLDDGVCAFDNAVFNSTRECF